MSRYGEYYPEQAGRCGICNKVTHPNDEPIIAEIDECPNCDGYCEMCIDCCDAERLQ